MAKTTFIKRLISELSEEDYASLVGELLASAGDTEDNKAEEMSLVGMTEFTESAIEMYKNFGKMQGLSTGYPKIDKLTLGLAPGELILLAGKTSRGKTTLAMNIGNKVALGGSTVLFVTLKMTHEEITQRTMFINDCVGDKITDEYYEVAGRTVFQQSDELRWDSIDKLMQKAKEEMDVDLVIIDHLHYFTRELQNI